VQAATQQDSEKNKGCTT